MLDHLQAYCDVELGRDEQGRGGEEFRRLLRALEQPENRPTGH
jgi:hypothetical protein